VLLSRDATRVTDSIAIGADGELVGGADDRQVGCSSGQVLVRCDAGLRCSVPCDGVVGDDPSSPGAADPSCTLAAQPRSDGATDEAAYTCEPLSGGLCSAGTMACSSACFVPCDGSVGCAPNGRFGDEQPDLCGDATAGATLALAENPGVPALPAPRSGFASVYSRSLDRLFIAGGRDLAGALLHDLWTGRPTGGFVRLPLEQSLGEVLAATYDPAGRRLYLVDRALPKGAKKMGKLLPHSVRLLRVNPFDATVAVVATWPSLGLFDRYFLTADRDGGLLIAASSTLAHKHAIVRLALPLVKVTAIELESRQLASAPIADPAGYVRVTREKKTGRLLPERFELPTGEASPGAALSQVFQ
jgi:hypothetical protein